MADNRNISSQTLALSQIDDVIVSGATSGEVLTFNGSNWVNLQPVNIYTTSSSITANRDLDLNGFMLTVSNGVTQHHSFSSDGSIVFNESGGNGSFRIEGSTEPNLFILNSPNNNVLIGGGTSTARMHIKGVGTTSATTALEVSDSGDSVIASVKNDGSFHLNSYGNGSFNNAGIVYELGVDSSGNVLEKPIGVQAIRTVVSPYNAVETDSVIIVQSSTAVVTLPDPATVDAGCTFTVKCIAVSPTTAGVNTAAGLIDNYASITFAVQYEAVTCISDGSTYHII